HALAGLWRPARLPAHHSHHRDARPLAFEHRSRSSQAPPGRRRSIAAGLRGPVARALLSGRDRAREQGSRHRDRAVLRQAPGEIVMPLRLFASLLLFVPLVALAQLAPTRTWPELRDAVQDRVNRNAYPLTGYDKEEVREVLSRIHSLDRDEWARSWIQQGDKHLAKKEYLAAWRYYGFGAWPTQNSASQRGAHRRATAAFRACAASAEPAIEVLRVPFEGKELIAYLQLPANTRPAPVVMSVGGLGSEKEDV